MNQQEPIEQHEELIEQFRDNLSVTRAQGTANRYYHAAKKWFQWCQETDTDPFDATRADLRVHLRDTLQDGYSASTVRSQKTGVSMFYKELETMQAEGFDVPNVPEENPAEELDTSGWSKLHSGTEKAKALREDIHAVEREELEQIVQHVEKNPVRDELLIRLGFQTMARRSEIVDIRLSDIDQDERTINIRGEKAHTNREVYYAPSLDFLMSTWVDVHRSALHSAEESPYLFNTYRSAKMNGERANKIFQACCERAGVQETLYTDKNGHNRYKYGFHSLRHGGCVQAVRNGMSVKNLQTIAGHASLEQSERYLDLAQEDAQESARRFGPGTEQ